MCASCIWSSNAGTSYVCPFRRCVKRNGWKATVGKELENEDTKANQDRR